MRAWRVPQRAFMSTLAWCFLHEALAGSGGATRMAARILAETDGDGGRRRTTLLSRAAALAKKPLPKWLPLAIGAVALTAAVAVERGMRLTRL